MSKKWKGRAVRRGWGSITKGGTVTVSRLSTGEFIRNEAPKGRLSLKVNPPIPRRKKRPNKIHYRIATEKLMFSVLDKLYSGKQHKDHYRPKWLKNPDTNQNLELDRYYPRLKLAFEYNGRHHDNKYQMYKDGIKRDTCLKRGIALVIIQSTDNLPVEHVQQLVDKAKKELEEQRSV